MGVDSGKTKNENILMTYVTYIYIYIYIYIEVDKSVSLQRCNAFFLLQRWSAGKSIYNSYFAAALLFIISQVIINIAI